MDTSAREALIATLRANRDALVPHFAAPDADLARSYAPGKWTVRQILAHLADSEMINRWRFLRAVAEPGSAVAAYDQDAFCARLAYEERSMAVAGALFVAVRDALIEAVATLPDEALARTCVHPEKETVSGWRWAELAARHAAHHLEQVAAARAGRPWAPTPRPDAWTYGAGPRP